MRRPTASFPRSRPGCAQLGLQTDAIVGIQLPNTVESVLTILGVLRAGMIAAPLPLLWRRADMARALSPLGAKAIVTTSRIGDFDACAMAMQVAADLFTIRHVCSFGSNLPDGVIALDDLLQDARRAAAGVRARRQSGGACRAGDIGCHPDGLVAVARNHAELIAGGVPRCSKAASNRTLPAWLLRHGLVCGPRAHHDALAAQRRYAVLHHGFDAAAFAAQCREHRCDTVVVPGALVPQMAEAGLLAHAD